MEENNRIELIIFDVDGTLAEQFKLDLMPGVAEFFRLALSAGCPQKPRLAIATNQGGVGLRYWMEQEGWGSPKGYPTVEEIEERLRNLVTALSGGDSEAAAGMRLFSAFAYRDRKGKWNPVPAGQEQDQRWQQDWRKPGPGMLRAAMREAGACPERTLMVGDSEDDRIAAKAAGCHFRWAGDFFSHPWDSCGDLDSILVVQ